MLDCDDIITLAGKYAQNESSVDSQMVAGILYTVAASVLGGDESLALFTSLCNEFTKLMKEELKYREWLKEG